MANKWQGYTSEKLFLAELQLKEWDARENDKNSISSKAVLASYQQASMLLIGLGWEGFLNELADYHQQKSMRLRTLTQLHELIGDDYPELDYLLDLSKDYSSWLYDLVRLADILNQPQTRDESTPEFSVAKDALIAVSGVQEPIESLNNLKRILQEFKKYTKEVRERMSEW